MISFSTGSTARHSSSFRPDTRLVARARREREQFFSNRNPPPPPHRQPNSHIPTTRSPHQLHTMIPANKTSLSIRLPPTSFPDFFADFFCLVLAPYPAWPRLPAQSERFHPAVRAVGRVRHALHRGQQLGEARHHHGQAQPGYRRRLSGLRGLRGVQQKQQDNSSRSVCRVCTVAGRKQIG